MRNTLYLVFLLLLGSCARDSETEKHQSNRSNIINVKDKIKVLDTGDVLIGSVARLYMSDQYLLVADCKSLDKLIHLFNKDDFSHVVSTGDFGQGPNEITLIGNIGIDEDNHKLYVSDHGKQKILSYDMDSILVEPLYQPQVKAMMDGALFPSEFQYINDTLAIAVLIKPTSNSTFDQLLGKWNMGTGQIEPMEYTHPDIEKKRITFCASQEEGIYVECYSRHDLMTICSLDGELQCNVYGPDWDGGDGDRIHCYGKVMIGNDKILALYSGEDYNRDSFPTKILVFDLKGNYLKTLDTKYKIADCCYDPSNNRIIMSLVDEIQFAYLDIDGC